MIDALNMILIQVVKIQKIQAIKILTTVAGPQQSRLNGIEYCQCMRTRPVMWSPMANREKDRLFFLNHVFEVSTTFTFQRSDSKPIHSDELVSIV